KVPSDLLSSYRCRSDPACEPDPPETSRANWVPWQTSQSSSNLMAKRNAARWFQSNEGGRLMKGRLICRSVLTAFAMVLWFIGRLNAGDVYKNDVPQGELTPLPPPAQVQSLNAYPEKINLKGSDDAQQLVLTATLAEGRLQDLSANVKFDVADPKIA